mmetsp:Transcript_135817/g.378500  ORF Transcript_135817/g.378500 Transcript_135817/m.378500 type:complete len:227 (+) Transcript_135817:771-1451(+)
MQSSMPARMPAWSRLCAAWRLCCRGSLQGSPDLTRLCTSESAARMATSCTSRRRGAMKGSCVCSSMQGCSPTSPVTTGSGRRGAGRTCPPITQRHGVTCRWRGCCGRLPGAGGRRCSIQGTRASAPGRSTSSMCRGTLVSLSPTGPKAAMLASRQGTTTLTATTCLCTAASCLVRPNQGAMPLGPGNGCCAASRGRGSTSPFGRSWHSGAPRPPWWPMATMAATWS